MSDGAYSAINDLVMLVPVLASGAGTTAVAVGKGIGRAASATKRWVWDENGVSQMLDKMSLQTVQNIGSSLNTAYGNVRRSLHNAGESLANAYAEGGARGAASSVAVAMFGDSPHEVVGDFLNSLGHGVWDFMSSEWTAFHCMTIESRIELACKTVSYILSGYIGGNWAIGKLRHSTKLKALLAQTKNQFKRLPFLDRALMKSMTRITVQSIDDLEKIHWMTDSHLLVGGSQVDVASYKGIIYARTLNSNNEIVYYTLKGKLRDAVANRILSTTTRNAAATNVSSSAVRTQASHQPLGSRYSQEVFDPRSNHFARNPDDFIKQVNHTTGVIVPDNEASLIAGKLSSQTQLMDDYSTLMRRVSHSVNQTDDLMSVQETTTKALEGYTKHTSDLHQIVTDLNKIIIKSNDASKLNLKFINSVIDGSTGIGDTNTISNLSKMLSEIAKSNSDSITGSIAEWIRTSPQLSGRIKSTDIQLLRRCLLNR